MKNIHIPEPCSENWKEMTPSEKGAFCQKCSLDVYDFTNKSGDEIRDILTLNIGSRVCGRIEPQQLAELNHDFSVWKINNQRSYQRAWLFSLFVVFGMTLFSCEEDEAPVVKQFQRTAQVILSNETEPDSLVNEVKISESVNTNTKRNTSIEKPEIIEPEELKVMGGMEYVLPEVVVEREVIPEVKVYPMAMLGAMEMRVTYQEYLTENIDSVEEKYVMSAITYPNPAVNETILKVDMPEKAKGEIELFALSGQKIKTIYSGRLQKGETTFDLDITDLETGNYLIVIYADGQKEIVQFTKL